MLPLDGKYGSADPSWRFGVFTTSLCHCCGGGGWGGYSASVDILTSTLGVDSVLSRTLASYVSVERRLRGLCSAHENYRRTYAISLVFLEIDVRSVV